MFAKVLIAFLLLVGVSPSAAGKTPLTEDELYYFRRNWLAAKELKFLLNIKEADQAYYNQETYFDSGSREKIRLNEMRLAARREYAHYLTAEFSPTPPNVDDAPDFDAYLKETYLKLIPMAESEFLALTRARSLRGFAILHALRLEEIEQNESERNSDFAKGLRNWQLVNAIEVSNLWRFLVAPYTLGAVNQYTEALDMEFDLGIPTTIHVNLYPKNQVCRHGLGIPTPVDVDTLGLFPFRKIEFGGAFGRFERNQAPPLHVFLSDPAADQFPVISFKWFAKRNNRSAALDFGYLSNLDLSQRKTFAIEGYTRDGDLMLDELLRPLNARNSKIESGIFHVTRLALRENNITDQGAAKLYRSIFRGDFPNLSELDLGGNPISKKWAQDFMKLGLVRRFDFAMRGPKPSSFWEMFNKLCASLVAGE